MGRTSMCALPLQPAGWAGLCALLLMGGALAQSTAAPAEGSNFDNLEIVDSSLNEKLTVTRVGSSLADNNLLSVFAGLKNKTARRLALEVETIYKDKAGDDLNTGSWIRVTLDPHEERDYRSTAISEQAVDFLIRIRKATSATAAYH